MVSARINALAHRVMQAGLKANALTGDDLKPWHMKMDFQVIKPGSTKPVSGSMEEWYLSPYQWRRLYQGHDPDLNGSEWSVSKTEHYQSKPGHDGFSHRALNLRVSRPVIDPLYQTANIQPEYEMDVRRLDTAGLTLNCISVLNASRYAEDTNPDWLFPTMCFDKDYHLRLTSVSDTTVQFEDLQPFQGRTVARDVKVIFKGSLIAEMKVSLLESLTNANADLTRPPKDAVPEPYTIEPGHLMPEPIYEVAAQIPQQINGAPVRGTFPIPILIRKDGTVKVRTSESYFWNQNLKDALTTAVNKWRYNPYLVDGQPVEVALIVFYAVDGKPFVPSYERGKTPPVVTCPDDYSSAYDPKRDPAKDLMMAQAAAAQAHKRILMEVGGDWCTWCKYFDKVFTENADLRDMRDASFIVMKINMSSTNENSAFLDRFPKIPAYPFFFVLDADGKVLTAQKSSDLEGGPTSHSAARVKEFLTAWKPQ